MFGAAPWKLSVIDGGSTKRSTVHQIFRWFAKPYRIIFVAHSRSAGCGTREPARIPDRAHRFTKIDLCLRGRTEGGSSKPPLMIRRSLYIVLYLPMAVHKLFLF